MTRERRLKIPIVWYFPHKQQSSVIGSMLRFLRCGRVGRLVTLIFCHTLVITVLLTPLRIMSLIVINDVPDQTDLDFTHNITTLLDTAHLVNNSNSSYGNTSNNSSHGNLSKLNTSLETDSLLVKTKLDTLKKLVPMLNTWFEEGLKTNPPAPLANMTKAPICDIYKKEATVKRHVVLNVFSDRYPSMNKSDVTLATQGTINRMMPLVMAAKNWAGPMQVALHLSQEDIANLTNVFSELDVQNQLLKRTNIIINFIVKIGNFYPINYLRNLVLNHTRTPWILITDIDFVPNIELYNTSLNMLKNYDAKTHTKVYVVPCFSGLVEKLVPFPRNKSQLMTAWNKSRVEQTQKGMQGQKNTDYKRWPASSAPYLVKWKTDYEPYIIGPTETLPKYDEYFLQRVLDKCAQIMETNTKGFEFWVLPDGFIIHIEHERRPGQEYHAGCAHDYYHKVFKSKVRKQYQAASSKITYRKKT